LEQLSFGLAVARRSFGEGGRASGFFDN
jgi:hypothetical protein